METNKIMIKQGEDWVSASNINKKGVLKIELSLPSVKASVSTVPCGRRSTSGILDGLVEVLKLSDRKFPFYSSYFAVANSLFLLRNQWKNKEQLQCPLRLVHQLMDPRKSRMKR